jgi:hypothetical protein
VRSRGEVRPGGRPRAYLMLKSIDWTTAPSSEIYT